MYNYNRWGNSDFQLEMNNATANSNRADRGDGGGLYIGLFGNINSKTSVTQYINAISSTTLQTREAEEQFMNYQMIEILIHQ